MVISHCYWHVVVNNEYFPLLLIPSGQESEFSHLWTFTGKERQFHIATEIYWGRMAISLCYLHLIVKNGNFILLLTSNGQEWQFYSGTSIYMWRMAISHCYWNLLVKNVNFTLLLTSSGEEWKFHIGTDIYLSQNGNITLLLKSTGLVL